LGGVGVERDHNVAVASSLCDTEATVLQNRFDGLRPHHR
jgi:hypothetical protein